MDFVVVEGDFPFWRGFVVEEWKRLPHRTLLLSRAPALWRKHDYDAVETYPVRDDGTLDGDALGRIARGFGSCAGAVTLFEPAVGLALDVQRALGLPEISSRPVRDLRNKAAMVEVMRQAGLGAPRTVHGTEAADVVARATAPAAGLSFPLVVKPSELAGKAGVRLAADRAELQAAVEAALAETLPFEIDGNPASVASTWRCERGVLVQEYIEGDELSVEGYAAGGEVHVLAVTEKVNSGPPLFEELAHLQPARLTPPQERAVHDYAVAAVRAFGLRASFFHLELRLRGFDECVLMEINCRLAGDMIPRMLELRSGMNVGDTLLRVAAGERVEPPSRWVGAAGVRMATVAAGGTLRSLRLPLIRSEREAAVFDIAPGDPVHAPKSGGVTRLGYFLATGETADQVEKRLDALARETVAEVG